MFTRAMRIPYTSPGDTASRDPLGPIGPSSRAKRAARGAEYALFARLGSAGARFAGLGADALPRHGECCRRLEQLAAARPEPQMMSKTYAEALELYSLARGGSDVYKLDTRFEIAAMKVTTFMEGDAHLWAKPVAMPRRPSFNQGTR